MFLLYVIEGSPEHLWLASIFNNKNDPSKEEKQST